MRSLLAALAFLGMACYSAVPAAEEQPMPQQTSFRVLRSGGYGRTAETGSTRGGAPRVLIATTDGEYRSLWREHIGDDPAPAVDFGRESAVFLLLGVRSTGGYAIDAKEAKVENGVAHVTAPVTSPSADTIVTMAITAPFSVVAVGHPNITAAEWRDGGRVVARADHKVR